MPTSLEHAAESILLLGSLRAQLHLELLELGTHLAALRVELGGGHQVGLGLVEILHAQVRLPAPQVALERGGLEQQRRVARLDGGGEVSELEVALRGVEVARELDLGRGGPVRRYLRLAPAARVVGGEVRLLHDGVASLVELESTLELASLEAHVTLLLPLLLQAQLGGHGELIRLLGAHEVDELQLDVHVARHRLALAAKALGTVGPRGRGTDEVDLA
mmetsp:Transcript_61476/g.148047  ORF Transcript_61476/g.148047 Transcript_61476/m.148047 type:complete len:219 (-) Transcript_61476:1677-2333(-)